VKLTTREQLTRELLNVFVHACNDLRECAEHAAGRILCQPAGTWMREPPTEAGWYATHRNGKAYVEWMYPMQLDSPLRWSVPIALPEPPKEER
jgi:hypothetical protein